jgi:hypothetical protein
VQRCRPTAEAGKLLLFAKPREHTPKVAKPTLDALFAHLLKQGPMRQRLIDFLIGFLLSVAIGAGIGFFGLPLLLSVKTAEQFWPLVTFTFLLYLAIDLALIERSRRTRRAKALGVAVGLLLVVGLSGLFLSALVGFHVPS